jgi:O-acetyl-ADP-ribose deacetylase (regulator of RNase III)
VAVNPGKNMRVGGNKMNMQAIRTKDGKLWQPAYTSEDQLKKTGARKISVLTFPIENLFKRMLEQKDSPDKIAASISGIVLNLQDKSMFLPLGAIDAILKANEEVKKKQAGASRIVFAKGDITQFKADAIVNAANESLRPGGGVCGAIHAAAGPELAEACAKLGGCRTGEAVITDAYNLPHKKVIHAVGPVYHGTDEDRTLLAEAYRNSLTLARDNKLKSVVFPAISTGIFGYPKEEAAKIAFGACAQWIRENQSYGMTVIMCAYDQETFDIYQKFIPKKKS